MAKGRLPELPNGVHAVGKVADFALFKVGNGDRKVLFITEEFHKPTSDNKSKALQGTFRTLVNVHSYVAKYSVATHTVIYASSCTAKDKQNRIEKLVKKVKPDVVMVDRDIAQFVTDEYYKEYGMFIKNKKLGVPVVCSLPVWGWASYAAKEEGGGNNLIGQVIYHFLDAVEGKNKFKVKSPKRIKPKVVETIKGFRSMMKHLTSSKVVAIDTEGRDLSKTKNGQLFTIQFATAVDKSFFLPLWHSETPWTSKEIKEIKETLCKYFEGRLKTKVKRQTHVYANGGYDLNQFRSHFDIRWYCHKIYDVPGAEFSIDENLKFLQDFGFKRQVSGFGPYSLEAIEYRYGFKRPPTAVGKADRQDFSNRSLEELRDYSCLDVVSLILIREQQLLRCTKPYVGYKSIKQFNMVVTSLIGDCIIYYTSYMEHRGSHIDYDWLVTISDDNGPFGREIANSLTEFKKSKYVQAANSRLVNKSGLSGGGLFGKEPWVFDPSKPEHLRILFFDELKLQPLSYGKLGDGSVNAQFKKEYKSVEEVALLDAYDKNSKLKSTFADGILRAITHGLDSKFTKRLHASFIFLYVLTGRLSSRDPNLQNIPSHGPLAKLIKKLFKAPEGRVLVKADFNAHEVRAFANITKDKNIAKAFLSSIDVQTKFRLAKEGKQLEKATVELKQKGDVHIQNVFFFFNKWVTKADPLRQGIKAIVFGALYGKGPGSLALDVMKKPNPDRVKELKKEIKQLKKEIKAA